MTIAELEGDSVVTDALHPQDSDTRELPWAITTPALAQDVDLAHVFGAGGTFTEELTGQKVFLAILPSNRYERSDQLDVPGGSHRSRTKGILPFSQAGMAVGRP